MARPNAGADEHASGNLPLLSSVERETARDETDAVEPTIWSRLLLVALDGPRIAHGRRVGIRARMALAATLSKQIPVLVEPDLHVLETPCVGVRELAGSCSLAQLSLFFDELLDALKHLFIVHERYLGADCRIRDASLYRGPVGPSVDLAAA